MFADLLSVINDKQFIKASISQKFEETSGLYAGLEIFGSFQIPAQSMGQVTMEDKLRNMGVPQEKINEFVDVEEGWSLWDVIDETIARGLRVQESVTRDRGIVYRSNVSELVFEAQTPEYDRDTRFREEGEMNSETDPSEAIINGEFAISYDFQIYYKVILYRPSGHDTLLFVDVPNFALPALVELMTDWFSRAKKL